MEMLQEINEEDIIRALEKDNFEISKIIENAIQAESLTSVDYDDIYKAFGDDFSSIKYRENTINLNNVVEDVKNKISSILGRGSIYIYIKRK